MAEQQFRSVDLDDFEEIPDQRSRDSFRQLFDNTRNLQAQIDKLVELVTNSKDLGVLQAQVSESFTTSTTTTSTTTTSTGSDVSAFSAQFSAISHNHDSDYADASHAHTGVYQPAGSYASSGHAHTGVYQPAGSYASSGHSHSGYASSGHSHSGYASSGHSHSGYASSSHSHSGYVADTNTYWKNAIESYSNGSSYHSDLPYRLSSQAGSQIFTFIGNAAGTNMMIYRNGSFYRWVGTNETPTTITDRLKTVGSYRYTTSTAIPFSNADRPSRVYLRNQSNNLEAGMLYLQDYLSGIGLYLYRYTLNSGTSTTPTYTYNAQTFIASA